MESILVLAHTEAGRQPRQTRAGGPRRGPRTRRRRHDRTRRRDHPAGGRPGRAQRRGPISRRHRRSFRPAPICDRCRCCRGPLPRVRRRDRDCARHVAMGARAARRGVPIGGPRRHARDCLRDRERRARRDALVLSPADGGRAHPLAAARGSCCSTRGASRRGADAPAAATVEAVAVETPATRTTVLGVRSLRRRPANHPSGRQAALRRRRRMDQEAVGRRAACRRSREVDSRVSCAHRRPRSAAASRSSTSAARAKRSSAS